MLRAHEPYIFTGTAALTFEGLVATGQIQGEIAEVEPRPMTADAEKVLVFFMGEVGDAAATLAAASAFYRRHNARLDFVTAQGDECLLNAQATFEYPITLRQAEFYDAWIEFDSRARIESEMTDALVNPSDLYPPTSWRPRWRRGIKVSINPFSPSATTLAAPRLPSASTPTPTTDPGRPTTP